MASRRSFQERVGGSPPHLNTSLNLSESPGSTTIPAPASERRVRNRDDQPSRPREFVPRMFPTPIVDQENRVPLDLAADCERAPSTFEHHSNARSGRSSLSAWACASPVIRWITRFGGTKRSSPSILSAEVSSTCSGPLIMARSARFFFSGPSWSWSKSSGSRN